ncbi:MAG TPA: dihydrodipicolinate reductase C-terminal domain-containing protein [Vicinamibacterales bacterium]|nr:dihydrodipicolinate reductase C-terminal domain-containing protein [Vicinamibacterales bacterium]
MSAGPLRVLLIGHGRMGRLVDQLADEYGVDIVGRVTRTELTDAGSWPAADVAIDFSAPEAIGTHARAAGERGMCLVIGTTGWQDREDEVRRALAPLPVGVIAAPNFAIGVNVFNAIAERSAQLLVERGFAPWIHEAHHAAKKDAPSGTALALQRVVEAAGGAPVHVSATRAGSIPGTHTVGFDAPTESISLTHVARDRTPFARGALEAARWVHRRRGWFTMRDMLDL